MACCILAAFLIAQCMATLRRWGVFWHLLPVPEGENPDTALTRLNTWLRRPRVRAGIACAVMVELTVLGSWVYVEHGRHIAEFADVQWAHLHGERVVYAKVCDQTGQTSIRMVLEEMRRNRVATRQTQI